MFGASLTIPITKGRLNMGTWQVRMNWLWPMSHLYRSSFITLPGGSCKRGALECVIYVPHATALLADDSVSVGQCLHTQDA